MNNAKLYFIELLRIAIGAQNRLSQIPKADEWVEVFNVAMKQSLVGICFVAVQKVNKDSSSQAKYLPTDLYLKWLAVSGKIQQRNELQDKRCHELCAIFSKSSFYSCILKGQGLAKMYGEVLHKLRQSGDIDVWLWPKNNWIMGHDERMKQILAHLPKYGSCSHLTYHNSSVKMFSDIEVEAHFTPSWLYSPVRNRRMQQWFKIMAKTEMNNDFSTIEFDMVYVLIHIYRHLFGEGIGLRQVLDYYFVLKSGQQFKQQSFKTIKQFGAGKFASALMYIMQQVFSMHEEELLCKPNLKEGEFLLNEMMLAGNFGQFDERINKCRNHRLINGFWMHVKRNFHFITHYPSEVVCCPFWKIWHQLWLIKMKKYKN